MWHFKNNDISCISKTALVSCASCSHMFVNMLKNILSARLQKWLFFIHFSNERTMSVESLTQDENSRDSNDSTETRKSKRSNRGQRYKALMKQGVLQGSREKPRKNSNWYVLFLNCFMYIFNMTFRGTTNSDIFWAVSTLTFMSFSDYYRKTSKPVDICAHLNVLNFILCF